MKFPTASMFGMAGSTALAQALTLAAAPVLTRIYSPSQFGEFVALSAAMFVFASFSGLKFEQGVALASDNQTAGNLLQISLWSSLVLAVAFTVTLATISAGLGSGPLEHLWAAPILALPLALYAAMTQHAVRVQAYGAIARRNMLAASAVAGLQIGLGWLNPVMWTLAIGYSLGQMAGVAALAAKLPRDFIRPRPLIPDLAKTAKLNKRYATVLAPAALANSLGLYLPIFIIIAAVGSAAAGAFGLATRVLALPMTLIGQAVAQAYLGSEAASLRTDGLRNSNFLKVSCALSAVAVPCAAVVYSLSPIVFPLIFGRQWETAGEIASVMAPVIGAQLVASPLMNTLIITGRIGWSAGWDIARVVVVSGGLVGLALLGQDLYGLVLYYSLVGAAMYAIGWFLAFLASRSHRIKKGRGHGA